MHYPNLPLISPNPRRAVRPALAALVLVATTTLGCGHAPPVGSPPKAPPVASAAGATYLMASLVVRDFEVFQHDYGTAVFPLIMAAGGEVLVATPTVDLREGAYAQNWTVVVRFPSAQAAQRWYESADYQALIPVRHGATDPSRSSLLFAPAFVP